MEKNNKVHESWWLRPADDKAEYKMIHHTTLVCPFCGGSFAIKQMEAPIDYFNANDYKRSFGGHNFRMRLEDYEKMTLICTKCHIEISGLKNVGMTIYDETDYKNAPEEPSVAFINVEQQKTIEMQKNADIEDFTDIE